MKVLTEADYIALGNLCQAYSILIDAQIQMNKTGILYKTKSGYIQQSPLLGIIHTQTTDFGDPVGGPHVRLADSTSKWITQW
jgi:phage terminase small subunit